MNLKQVNVMDIIVANCGFYILLLARISEITDFDRMGLLACVGWMALRFYHLIKQEENTNNVDM